MANPGDRDQLAPGPVQAAPTQPRQLPRTPTPLEVGLKIAFGAIADGAYKWFSLLSATGMFAYTAHDPTLLRWGVTASYTVLVFLIPLIRSKEN